MRISVYAPVKNEAEYLGYSIMAVAPYVHEFLYGVSPSTDETMDILKDIKGKHVGNKLKIFEMDDFDVRDQKAYEGAYNFLIQKSTGDALWYLHADMICVNAPMIEHIQPGPLAWWTFIRSFAGNRTTEITRGRADKWKNIHANKFGLHYAGAYGSQNEDMYFRDITGTSYRQHDNFMEYPYEIASSKLIVHHYCESKTYSRRLEKMKICLKQQNPHWDDALVNEMATIHPRVTLEPSSERFGHFEFKENPEALPPIFKQYNFKEDLWPTVTECA